MTTADALEARQAAFGVQQGERDFTVLYRIPAGDDYPHGDEVGWVKTDDWLLAMIWGDDRIAMGFYAIELGEFAAPFPAGTRWMITNNSAIDHGLEHDV